MRVLVVLAAACGSLCLSSAATARDDAQLWTGANATVDLGEHLRFQQDLTLRFSDNRHGLYEIEANSLLGYAFNKSVAVWAGYTHDPQYAAGHFTVMERRAREQVTFDNVAKIGGGTLSGRLRLEQRWREGIEGTGWRFRPFIRYSLPFRPGHKTALVLSHESFVDLNKTNFQSVSGEERMRNFAGISTPLIKHVGVEIGYMNQYSFVPRGPDNIDHAASVTLNFAF